MTILLPFLLAFAAPQPQLSQGRLVNYGSQEVVLANFRFHGYDPQVTHGCGLAAISPAMLGRIAWVSVNGALWAGPCTVVDVAGRDDAQTMIFQLHEVAEVPRWMARALGFEHGASGYVFFGQCPPLGVAAAQPYAPRLHPWQWPLAPEPYRAYPKQQTVTACQ